MKRFTQMLTSFVMAFALSAYAEENPYEQPDATWISLDGTVTSTERDAFRLDYGEGLVTVEMDDWDMDADGYKLIEGDEVTVYGYVDDDLFETTTIEASSVYVDDLNTYFYASGADEEDLPAIATVEDVGYDLEIRGTVEKVNGREFTIDTGEQEIRVDTIALAYNPLDDEGYQQVDVGDRVSVTGDIDADWWEERELLAESVVTLEDRRDS